ncbi:hypothetical protein AYI69_g6785, partial [Smittium culicis]
MNRTPRDFFPQNAEPSVPMEQTNAELTQEQIQQFAMHKQQQDQGQV